MEDSFDLGLSTEGPTEVLDCTHSPVNSQDNTSNEDEEELSQTSVITEGSDVTEFDSVAYNGLSQPLKHRARANLARFNIQDVYEHAEEKFISPKSAAKDLERICVVSALKQDREERVWAGEDISSATEVSESDFMPSSVESANMDNAVQDIPGPMSPRSKVLLHPTLLQVQSSQDRHDRLDQSHS